MTTQEEETFNKETVSLDQDFWLFALSRIKIDKAPDTSREIPPGTILGIQSKVVLSFPLLPDIPIVIDANMRALHRFFGATPFDPEIGTLITPEDFKIESRIKKWTSLRQKRVKEFGKSANQETADPRAPLSISIGVDYHIFQDPKFTIPSHFTIPGNFVDGYEAGEIRPEIQEAFRHLVLTLTFPESTWIGVPSGMEENDSGRLDFFYFHPSDTPTLAVAPERGWNEGGALKEGVELFVPDNPDKLALIKGRFSKKTTSQ